MANLKFSQAKIRVSSRATLKPLLPSYWYYEKESHDVQNYPTSRFSVPDYGLGKADGKHDAAVVMNKGRTCKKSELYQVANTVVASPKPIVPDNFDRAWASMRVPKLSRTMGTCSWSEEWCTAYDERWVLLPITGYILVPNKQRYIDPDFEADLKEACETGEEWATICACRAIKLGLAGRPVRRCPAC